MTCNNQCQTCRFYKGQQCVKHNIAVKDIFEACNDYASNKEMTETYNGKLQLND